MEILIILPLKEKIDILYAVVRYNDKNNFYKPAIEYVEDFNAFTALWNKRN